MRNASVTGPSSPTRQISFKKPNDGSPPLATLRLPRGIQNRARHGADAPAGGGDSNTSPTHSPTLLLDRQSEPEYAAESAYLMSLLMNREPRVFSRRQLGRCAALAAAAAVGVPAAAQSPVTPGNQTGVDAKYANVLRKYGDRLSAEQRKRARETIIGHERMLARIRDFPLENGDAPATGFRL